MSDNQPAVTANSIHKYFGDVVALDGVDLEIASGEIRGIAGPNGAGKTTLLGLLLGLAAADDGELTVLGTRVRSVLGAPEGVSGFVDAPGLYPSLTARQNLAQICRLRHLETGPVDDSLAEVGLAEVADERVRGFSLGMRQRLGLAAAMMLRPRLLILDEPSNGLDPAGRRDIQEVLTRLAGQGTAVVISSHRMDDLSLLCSAVTVLSSGRVAFDGPISSLAPRTRAVDYRLITTDPDATGRLAAGTPGIEVTPGHDADPTRGVVLHATEADMNRLISRVVAEDIGLREFAPVVPPLEAAFLELTGRRDVEDEDVELERTR